MPNRPIRLIQIGVTDLDRSVAFYTDVLGLTIADRIDGGPGTVVLSADTATLRLTQVGVQGERDKWLTNDLQRGFRHLGFKVNHTDTVAQRVRDAGIPLHLEPTDAEGCVRIAFFQDPDGVMLEVVQGDLHYHQVLSQDQVDAERDQPEPDLPRFDHLAVTTGDLQGTTNFLTDALGYLPMGRLLQAQDPRGFVITYLRSQGTVFEVFSFNAVTTASPWKPGSHRLGFRAVGLDSSTEPGEEASAAALSRAGAVPAPGGVWLSPEGLPLELVTTL